MKEGMKWWLLILDLVLFIIGLLFGEAISTPTALEVYQGKTTLEITYRGGVPIDSTVVYK